MFSRHQALRTRNDGNPRLFGQVPSSMLKSECFNALWRGTCEDNPRSGGSSGKVGILRQETVSGDDSVNIVSLRDVYDLISIALLARWRTRRVVIVPIDVCF